ncbi:MAG: hypothetical protein LBR11_09580 [Deltaproteobacteria bacterium]|jgi:hypothetical protein|nr:hypothetical protein [Deltaproteobacteria bacterium]
MTSTNEPRGGFDGHKASRRILAYLEALGFSPAEGLTLAQRVLAQNPLGLAEALDLLKSILPARPGPTYPPSQPPLNRQSMITDKLSNGDFFNDLEL